MRRLAAATAVLAVGCSSPGGDAAGADAPGCGDGAAPLVGAWAGASTLELAADGAFTFGDGARGAWQATGERILFSYLGDPFLVSRDRPFALDGDRLGLGAYRRTSAGDALAGSTWLEEETTVLRAGSSAVQRSTHALLLAADGTAESRFVNMVAGMSFTTITPGTWAATGDAVRLELAPQGGAPYSVEYVSVAGQIANSKETYARAWTCPRALP